MVNGNLKTNVEAEEYAAADLAIQHEDAALKTAFLYFSEELLPYFGITKKVVGAAATDMMKLELEKYHEDFNFIMEDGFCPFNALPADGRRDVPEGQGEGCVKLRRKPVRLTGK